jgi:hypothetical protein
MVTVVAGATPVTLPTKEKRTMGNNLERER